MDGLLQKIQTNARNAEVLAFLKATHEKYFTNRADPLHNLHEGAQIFFDNYGSLVPEETKFLLGIHCIMANETTGEIFAFNTGRLSVFLKCDYARTGITNSDSLRKGDTIDSVTDITILGSQWCFLNKFTEDEQEQLKLAYELTQEV